MRLIVGCIGNRGDLLSVTTPGR